jgi:putative transposase
VYFAGCAAHPDSTQQARQMTWELEDRDPPMKYLIRAHDTRFTQSFDTVFEAAGIEIVNIPYQAPLLSKRAWRHHS